MLETIGEGSYSEVKRAVRRSCDKEGEEELGHHSEKDTEVAEFAIKIMHKQSLESQRAIRYDLKGEMQMINNLDKVMEEVDIWR